MYMMMKKNVEYRQFSEKRGKREWLSWLHKSLISSCTTFAAYVQQTHSELNNLIMQINFTHVRAGVFLGRGCFLSFHESRRERKIILMGMKNRWHSGTYARER